jgi:hypothetical protein
MQQELNHVSCPPPSSHGPVFLPAIPMLGVPSNIDGHIAHHDMQRCGNGEAEIGRTLLSLSSGAHSGHGSRGIVDRILSQPGDEPGMARTGRPTVVEEGEEAACLGVLGHRQSPSSSGCSATRDSFRDRGGRGGSAQHQEARACQASWYWNYLQSICQFALSLPGYF